MSRKTKAPKPTVKDRSERAKTRPFALHDHQPAGTKLLKRTFRAKYGRKAQSAEELARWSAVK